MKKKQLLLFIFGPLLLGVDAFCVVVLGLRLPLWVFFGILLISMPLGAWYVVDVWIHIYREHKTRQSEYRPIVIRKFIKKISE